MRSVKLEDCSPAARIKGVHLAGARTALRTALAIERFHPIIYLIWTTASGLI